MKTRIEEDFEKNKKLYTPVRTGQISVYILKGKGYSTESTSIN